MLSLPPAPLMAEDKLQHKRLPPDLFAHPMWQHRNNTGCPESSWQDSCGHKEETIARESRAAALSRGSIHKHTHSGKTMTRPESVREATSATRDTTMSSSQGTCRGGSGRRWNILVMAEALGSGGRADSTIALLAA